MTGDLVELVQLAQVDVSERRLARVYAEALLNAAEREQAAEEVNNELQALIAQVNRRDPFVRAFFTSGIIAKERRESVIKATFASQSHPLVLNVLLVLNDHDRLVLFRTVVEELQKLQHLRQRHFRVEVRSVVPLGEDQERRLLDYLRTIFRLEPILDRRIEPDLLGGMILRVADWVFDGSVRTQLVNLRQQLREMSSHEIQSRRDRFGAAEGN